MERLKRKHARIFWGLTGTFLGMEGLGWCLRTVGGSPWLLELSSWIGKTDSCKSCGSPILFDDQMGE